MTSAISSCTRRVDTAGAVGRCQTRPAAVLALEMDALADAVGLD
ncbi:hypothetical protein [Jiangella aurantiaca]|nr:hypothetical protein [Jiangella aurantiaca]